MLMHSRNATLALILGFLLMQIAASHAQTKPVGSYASTSVFIAGQIGPSSLSIYTIPEGELKSRLIVIIKPDGSIEYGEGYSPDAAAKAFWDAIGLERKARN
jgi:hypothetical protein